MAVNQSENRTQYFMPDHDLMQRLPESSPVELSPQVPAKTTMKSAFHSLHLRQKPQPLLRKR
jgi:hypothetical protein